MGSQVVVDQLYCQIKLNSNFFGKFIFTQIPAAKHTQIKNVANQTSNFLET
jgi:hypothetical protein